MLGAVFALGGSRTVLAIAPVALAHNLTESCLRVSAFAAGIVIAMVVFGAAASKLLKSSAFTLQRVAYLTGALCIAAGTWTIASRLHH
jgi:sulfite exporter TauE/SafE